MPKQKLSTDGSEEYEDTLSSPWFKVDLTKVQCKEVPTTGEEFLASVIAERRNIQAVIKCDFDYTKFNKNQSCFFEEVPVASAPDKLKPTIEWQNIQVADFSDVRMHISRLLAKASTEEQKIRKINNFKDDMQWWRNYFENHEPTLSDVLGFKASQMDQGLIILTKLLRNIKSGETIDHRTGKWIYSFLACKKQPLISDTVSIIRNLARQCAEIRSKIDPESENAHELALPLNLIICIVGRYFRQLDLADKKD